MRSVILTRPQAQAAMWGAALTEAGFLVESLPLIDIELLPCPELFFDLSAYSHLFFVSRNALAGILTWSDAASLANSSAHCLSPGSGTAQALASLGVATARIVQPPALSAQDSQGLWQVLQAGPAAIDRQSHLLVVQGSDDYGSQPNWLGQQAQALGAQVSHIQVYRRLTPKLTVGQAELALSAAERQSIWLFSSSQAILNLQRNLPDTTWQGHTCVCTHPRIAQTAAELGWQTHTCLPEPNAVVHLLQHLAA